ncbi:substrate-binding periplasmic protein [Marinobacterium rhizophilum]|uniref:substrate-binding periplasmic protein n=1 Tax=Marinobacterium rhizophilum TaxID=420402 RepID=UPI00035DEEE0|nr:transporter substrate-binding domain-containing protein [Marinobacterium rhizophilum]
MNRSHLSPAAWATLLLITLTGLQAQAGTLEQIQSRQQLGLCAHPDMLPFSKQSATASGPGTGFQIELAQALAQRLGVALNVSWIVSKRSASKTGCDLYAGVAKIDKNPSKYLRLSDPFLRLESVLVTRAGQPDIKALQALHGLRVGVAPGSVAAHRLNKQGIATASRYLDEGHRLQALLDGHIDAAVVTQLSAGWLQQQGAAVKYIDAEQLLGIELNYDYALGLRRADAGTVAQFNDVLADMKSDGSLAQLFQRYGLTADGQVALTHP